MVFGYFMGACFFTSVWMCVCVPALLMEGGGGVASCLSCQCSVTKCTLPARSQRQRRRERERKKEKEMDKGREGERERERKREKERSSYLIRELKRQTVSQLQYQSWASWAVN